MKILKTLTFLLYLFFFTTITYSQGNFSLHVGPSFPLLDFASDDLDNENAGGAAVGINVGLEYIYPLSDGGLGLFAGIDFNYNGLKKDVKDDVEELYETLGIRNAAYKFYNYVNIPVSMGLNYSYKAEDRMGVYANAGLALNFLKITDMEIIVNGQTVTTEMALANSLGLKIGGGLLIDSKTSLSIDYFGLGNHKLEGKVKRDYIAENIDGEGKVDILTVTLHYIF